MKLIIIVIFYKLSLNDSFSGLTLRVLCLIFRLTRHGSILLKVVKCYVDRDRRARLLIVRFMAFLETFFKIFAVFFGWMVLNDFVFAITCRPRRRSMHHHTFLLEFIVLHRRIQNVVSLLWWLLLFCCISFQIIDNKIQVVDRAIHRWGTLLQGNWGSCDCIITLVGLWVQLIRLLVEVRSRLEVVVSWKYWHALRVHIAF